MNASFFVKIVNNSQNLISFCGVIELTGGEMLSVMNLNVVAPILCAKLAVNSMQDRGVDDGHIFNVTRSEIFIDIAR
jgi:NAD(P)-dependent dehydrogenase (short-subunit alcohol dehydrogenase family)